MKTDEDRIQKVEVILQRNRSTVSTVIMANTALSRQDEKEQRKESESIGIGPQMPQNPKTSNTSTIGPSLPASKEKKKESSSLLDRLTIIDVKKTSSSKKKKVRRRSKHSIQRDYEAPPEELLLRDKQDSVSLMPDCFSYSNTSSKCEEVEPTFNANDNQPTLFTFDLMPSYTEASLQDDETDAGGSAGNDTTDANIGEEDDISGIFHELEESDAKCVNQMEEKYLMNKTTSYTDLKNEIDETNVHINMETFAALSKLELTSRTGTDSTALLSEVLSNDTSLQLDRESIVISEPSNSKKSAKDEASLSELNDLQVKASRCINIFSMFDSM